MGPALEATKCLDVNPKNESSFVEIPELANTKSPSSERSARGTVGAELRSTSGTLDGFMSQDEFTIPS